LKIGKIEFDSFPVLLAPMEDVTDPSFRVLCKEHGVDLMYTEFVNADGLIRGAKKGFKKIEIFDYERPIGIQIYGNEIEPVVAAAKIVERYQPDLIDLNFGCPVKKIANRGAGSGMMKDVPKFIEMTRKVVQAVNIPVTVKTRLGWDDKSKNIVEIAEKLQDTGIQALTIHGRTRAQMYKGEADWTLIGEIAQNENIGIPIIGNGDIDSPQLAKEAFELHKVDAIMIGRASIGRPWIFKDVKDYLQKDVLNRELTIPEKVKIIKRHLKESVDWKEERGGVLTIRRHYVQYFKGLPEFRDTKIKLLRSDSYMENLEILDYIAEKYEDY